MHHVRHLPLLLLLLLAASPAGANVPAAFFACEDLADGDPCQRPAGLQGGRCVRDTLCSADDIPDVDECVLCHDACFDQAPGTACLQATGESGICVVLPPNVCTELERTSFKECHRCESGQVDKTSPDEGCTVSGPGAAATFPWVLLLGIGLLQLRRRT